MAAEPLPAPDAMKVEQKYRSRSSPQIARAATDMAKSSTRGMAQRQCVIGADRDLRFAMWLSKIVFTIMF
jgi:hypothetical protein